MRLRLAGAIVALSLLAAVPATTASTSWQWQYKRWMPQHWINLAMCESGARAPADPIWAHSTAYEGAFGFAPSTWDHFKPVDRWPDAAYLATPWQQWATARRVAAYFHFRYGGGISSSWGCWNGPQHAWVRAGLPEHGTWR